MRKLLFLVIAAMGMGSGLAQTLVQTYTDRCTGEVKVFSVQAGSSTVVTFYNKSQTFTAAEFTNGTLQSWLESTYQWWRNLSPCSAGNATTNTTQNTTSQATSNATSAANNATSSSGTTGNTNTGSTNTNTNGNTGSTSTGNTESGGTSSSSTGGNSSGSSDSSGGDTGSNTNNDSGSSDSSGESSSGSSDSGSSDNSSDQDSSSGNGDSSDDSSSGGSENDSGNEESESSSGETSEESSNEENKEDSESKSEETESEESEESESEEVEEEEEQKEEETTEEESKEEEEEEEKKLAPPVVSANIVTMQMVDGILTNAASFGYSQSSLTGEDTYTANAMLWSNFKQYSINIAKSHVFFNYDKDTPVFIIDPDTKKAHQFGSYKSKGTIMKVQNLSVGYMRMYSTHIGTFSISDVYMGQKDNAWKGFVGGWAITGMGVFLEGGDILTTAALTAFGTKPINFRRWDRLTISPMLAYSMTPITYDIKANKAIFTKHGNWVIGSNFDFNLTQRFKANLGGTLIGNTMPGMPLSWALTIGSRFQF